MYAIIDIETTGGRPQADKITEIAVLIHDGCKVVREFNSLINPECNIPYHISALTGITNEMVADAPRFFEIAKELIEITDNKIFVAHNAAFDYGFVRSEFKRLGYDYKRDHLCTVQLSRKLIPGHTSYSLGRLCQALGISINDRHRAMGDASATATLFGYLLEMEANSHTDYLKGSSRFWQDLHPSLDILKVKNLTENPGVYYFYNQAGELIYIGKSLNIKNRVLSHFSNSTTRKAMQMRSQIADVGFEETGSELIALLKESFEIKKHKPLYNKKQRRSLFRYELSYFTDDSGYLRFSLNKTTEGEEVPLASFTSKAEAHEFMNQIIDKFGLCQKLCGLYPSEQHCFHYEIGSCHGACIGKELPESYNKRAEKFISGYHFGFKNLLIIDAGRHPDEKSVVKIEHGKYFGYGYFTPSFALHNKDLLHDCITAQPDNREVQQIIKQFIRKNKVEKVIYY